MQEQCSFPGCDKPHSAKGLCFAHYMQTKRPGELRPLRVRKPRGVPCEVAECESPALADGLCQQHYHRRIYEGDKVAHLARVAARKRMHKERLDEIKVSSGCSICGYSAHPSALDFHHNDQSRKHFNIGKAVTYNWERIQAEVDKCVVVCANCHRVLSLSQRAT